MRRPHNTASINLSPVPPGDGRTIGGIRVEAAKAWAFGAGAGAKYLAMISTHQIGIGI
jgi:hypothetical protein